MRKSILIGGNILCLFILCNLSIVPSVSSSDINYKIFDSKDSQTLLRFYFGEAHNCYDGEDYSEFQTNNVIVLRYWRNDTDWGINFSYYKGSCYFWYDSCWKFYGMIKEGFICGFFYAKIEL